jgi:DNA-binding response OmpR family regulator
MTQYSFHEGPLSVNFHTREVRFEDQQLVLTRKEYELLARLIERRGASVPRTELLSEIFGYAEGCRTRTLDVHIRRLRRKLGAFGESAIGTVFGCGYMFAPAH